MARIPCNTGGITTLWSLSRSQKKVVMKCISDFCSQSSGSFCNTSARICIPFSLNSGFLSVSRGPNFSTSFKRSALWPWIPEAKMTHVFYIHLLNPWSRVLLEELTGSQVVKKFPAFHGTWRFITVFTIARHLYLSWARSIQSMSPHLTSRWSLSPQHCTTSGCRRRSGPQYQG